MATTNQFKINGLIDTSKNVLENLNSLANVSGCYLTWDPDQGKWIVILNTTGTSVKTFNDSNILGEINLSGTGINELYNSVSITFPNKDTRDTIDVIELTIPVGDRFPQEMDNVLNLEVPIVNNPVQAAYIGSRELKQSRLDKIIEFRANFEANTIKAGDLIAVTNVPLNYTSKLFRVIQIEEEDSDDGNLIFSITAQEYDANIYSDSGLTYEYRSNSTGIKSKIMSEELDKQDDISAGSQIGRLLAANAALGLINSLFTVDPATGAIINQGKFADPIKQTLMESLSCPDATAVLLDASLTNSNTEICDDQVDEGLVVISFECDDCYFKTTRFVYTYEITGLAEGDIDIPLSGYCSPRKNNSGDWIVSSITDSNGLNSSDSLRIRGNNILTSNKSFQISINNGDLNQTYQITGTLLATPQKWISSLSISDSPTKGDDVVVGIVGIGTWAIGDTINYTITDPGGIVDTPLSGSFVTTGTSTNIGSFTIQTTDDFSCGSSNVTLTLTQPAGFISTPCIVANNTITIPFGQSLNAIRLDRAVNDGPIIEGNNALVTLSTVNVPNGTTVNYTITGATSKISSPLTGTVTVNDFPVQPNGKANLTISTINDGVYTGTSNSVTVTFTSLGGGCSNVSTTITITEASAAPPADFVCNYVQVPVVWCGTFDGSTQYLKSLTVRKYAMLPVASSGGVAVPTSVTVTNPGTSSAAIVIGATVNVDTSSTAGGAQIDVITSFGTLPSGGNTLLTGTVSTVKGYW